MTNHQGQKVRHWSIGPSLPAALFSRGRLTGLCLAVSRLPETPPVTTALPTFLVLRQGPLRGVQHTGEMDEHGGEKVPWRIDVLDAKKSQEPGSVGRGPPTRRYIGVSRLPETPPVTTALPTFLLLRPGPPRGVKHTREMDEHGGDKVPRRIDVLDAKKVQEPGFVGRGPPTRRYIGVSRLPETPPVTTVVSTVPPLHRGAVRCVHHNGKMDELAGEKVRWRLGVVAAQGVQELFFLDRDLALATQGNQNSRAGLGVHGCNIMPISLRPRALYTRVDGAFGLPSTNNLFARSVASSRIDQQRIDEHRQWLHDVRCGQQFHTAFEACTVAVDITQVWRHNSYRSYIGAPLQQNVPNTCAIAASTKCVEIAHRRVYEAAHGANTFPCIAAAPRKLRSICRRREIWDQKNGAVAGAVLAKIMDEGGVRTTNAPAPAPAFLPLASWEFHSSDAGRGLTDDHIADLLDADGPFIGNIWVCPWYHLFDSGVGNDFVYSSGCARDPAAQESSQTDFDDLAGFHSVVCFEYRFCGAGMHVHVLDNHSATGPERWVHSEEIEEAYTIQVPLMDLIDPSIVYPTRGVLAD